MSAMLRQFVIRGAALYKQRQNIRVAMLCLQKIAQGNTRTISIGYRYFNEDNKENERRAPTENKGMIKEEELKPKMARSVYDRLVRSNKVVVFMKGTPRSPRCGFSNAVVQIFRMHGVDYDAHDVLANDEVREGIKQYTDWPTIPQVFINGEFIGGCDILLEMHQSGELVEQLQKAGITSQLLRMELEAQEKENQSKKDKRKNDHKTH